MLPWPGSIILLAPSDDGVPAETRRRVLDAVRSYPGLGAADVARQTDASLQLAEYHLHALVRSGLAEGRDEAGHTVYFAAQGDGDAGPVDRRDRSLVAMMRRPMVLRIALQLLESGSMPMGELATACGISPATATHHVKKMEKARAVKITQEGRSRHADLADADRLRYVLVHHPPPRDVVSGFIEMWDRLDV